jgi:HD superfamily phosphohydrolase YqeK
VAGGRTGNDQRQRSISAALFLRAEQEGGRAHNKAKAEVVPEHVMIIRKPGKRALRMSGEVLHYYASAVQVGNNAGNRHHGTLAAVQVHGVRSNPTD